MIEEKQTQEQLKLFGFLPSTTDKKERINEFFGNVNLHPIDCPHDDFVNYSSKNHSFYRNIFTQEIQLKGRLQENLLETLFENCSKIFKTCS